MKLETVFARVGRRGDSVLHFGGFLDSSLPESIGKLHKVKEIRLGKSPNLRQLPDSICELQNLERLVISNSGFSALPESIGDLPRLRHLTVKNSKLTSLPDSIGRLPQLQSLELLQCRITALPESIGELKSLRTIRLRSLPLRALPDAFTELSGLQSVYMHGNWLQALPDSIGALENLRVLSLRGNYLASLPQSVGHLAQLRELEVAHNRLHSLPDTLNDLTKLKTFGVIGNKGLQIPAEVENSSPKAILDFFFRSSRRRKLNEAKILLVGQGGVGKTSMVKRLLDGTFNEMEAKTDGISVREWAIGTSDRLRLNVWDFGGQEIMHATHQFFLTKRSVYLLVLDARAGERESNIHYWLEMIRIYGEKSPVFVVLNKSEQHYERLDENRLRLDYEDKVNFAGFHNVSCKTGAGLAELQRELEAAVQKMPHVSDLLPEDYFSVKDDLENRSAKTDFITEYEYIVACEKSGVTDYDEQRRLLRFLHDLGCVLHYDDPEQRYQMHDTRVLNPEWVTGGVYRVLNDAELLRQGNGIVVTNDFRRLLDPARYPEDRYPFLIDMMRKYELCFAFPGENGKLLVPELLSKTEPDVGWKESNKGDVLAFQYHYSVLPRGLIPRFVVRTHHLLTEQPTVWRAGVVLNVEECRVLVRGDLRAARVFVEVQGAGENRRRALAVIRDRFAAVHLSYGDLSAEAKVPLPLDPQAPPVDYHHLLKLERESVTEYWFEKAERAYNIRELLDGVDEGKFDVFLSHNSIEKPSVRELAKRLQQHGVRYWLDEEHLTPGELWQKEMAAALHDCRTIAVLVGRQGIGPWEEEEMSVALDFSNREKKRVIPVLLPGAPSRDKLPAQFAFLASRTWIKLDEGFEDAQVARLAQAIKKR